LPTEKPKGELWRGESVPVKKKFRRALDQLTRRQKELRKGGLSRSGKNTFIEWLRGTGQM